MAGPAEQPHAKAAKVATNSLQIQQERGDSLRRPLRFRPRPCPKRSFHDSYCPFSAPEKNRLVLPVITGKMSQDNKQSEKYSTGLVQVPPRHWRNAGKQPKKFRPVEAQSQVVEISRGGLRTSFTPSNPTEGTACTGIGGSGC